MTKKHAFVDQNYDVVSGYKVFFVFFKNDTRADKLEGKKITRRLKTFCVTGRRGKCPSEEQLGALGRKTKNCSRQSKG